jgi:hypothetical protein
MCFGTCRIASRTSIFAVVDYMCSWTCEHHVWWIYELELMFTHVLDGYTCELCSMHLLVDGCVMYLMAMHLLCTCLFPDIWETRNWEYICALYWFVGILEKQVENRKRGLCQELHSPNPLCRQRCHLALTCAIKHLGEPNGHAGKGVYRVFFIWHGEKIWGLPCGCLFGTRQRFEVFRV